MKYVQSFFFSFQFSSRSHAVFTIVVEHSERGEGGSSVVTVGKLRLVDLAGSERFEADAKYKHQEETKNINTSLYMFGKARGRTFACTRCSIDK